MTRQNPTNIEGDQLADREPWNGVDLRVGLKVWAGCEEGHIVALTDRLAIIEKADGEQYAATHEECLVGGRRTNPAPVAAARDAGTDPFYKLARRLADLAESIDDQLEELVNDAIPEITDIAQKAQADVRDHLNSALSSLIEASGNALPRLAKGGAA